MSEVFIYILSKKGNFRKKIVRQCVKQSFLSHKLVSLAKN